MLDTALIVFFPMLMIYSAFSDLFSMTISNKVSLALMVGFCVIAWWSGMTLEAFGWHWAMFALVLSITFTLFSFGIIGGGDAKLAAATALWFGWEYTMAYFLWASILGAILTLVLLQIRNSFIPVAAERYEWIARLYKADNGVPYGIALGIAALMIYPQTPWMTSVFTGGGF